jgi:DNA-binding transcriptional regulator LsrR (DeoR family)
VDTLVAAARLYHLENLSQAEVATRLGTSRSNVSRMLAAAVEQGVVEIRVNDPVGRERDLEEQLRRRFGLRAVRVARRSPTADPDRQVGAQAAALLVEELRDGTTVALSWGRALQSMVWQTVASRDHAVELVQLVGGLSPVDEEVSGHELVRELASRLGATYRYLHAPAVLSSAGARDSLLAERSIAEALGAARCADVAFVGIGTPSTGSSAAILGALALDDEERARFLAAGPVGDIAARWFDADGRPVPGAVHDRVLAVTLEDLAAVPTVVGVASGRVKAPGVLGALRGRLVDVLVCDEGLARAVLSTRPPTAPSTDPSRVPTGGKP